MIKETRAAVLRELGKPLSVETLRLPEELGVGQVLVKMAVAGVCGRQRAEASGAKGPDPYLPHLMGHEGSGTVVEVGPGVRKVYPDSVVCLHWRKGSGIDAEPPKYMSDHGEVGAGPVACFSDYAIVSENRITPIPVSMPRPEAALLGCGVLTGLGIAYNEARIQYGETVIVFGCGGVGLNVIQGARLAGAFKIVAVDASSDVLSMAQDLGATDAAISGLGTKDGLILPQADVIVDCTGQPEIINCAVGLMKFGGRMILVGQPAAGKSYFITEPTSLYCGTTIMDSQGGQADPDRDIPRCLDMWRAGRLKLAELIGKSYGLDEINEALSGDFTTPGRNMLILGATDD